MKRVIIESPYRRDVGLYTAYARRCMLDSLRRGEAPFLSHLLYTQVLPEEGESRTHGIGAGLAWVCVAELTVVYADHGVSEGMRIGIDHAKEHGHPIEYRYLDLKGTAP